MTGGGAILACSAARWHPPVAAVRSNMCYTPRRRTSWAKQASGSRMAASSKIVLHHVGGRWGDHPFPRLPAFAGDFVEVLYEADTDAIAAAVQERLDARKARDFARADAIRADLSSRGIVLEDGPGGTTWRRAL